MKVGNWEIEDSVLNEKWAAWEVPDPLMGTCTLLVTPSGWRGYTTLKSGAARLAMTTLPLDGSFPFAPPLRDSILDGAPPPPDVGCLDWDIVDNKSSKVKHVRYYSNFPAYGKLWYQGMPTPQTTTPRYTQVEAGAPPTPLISAKPSPTPHDEVVHTQTFYRESGNIELALGQTVQNARSKMSTRSSYPLCKCCGQLTDWSTKWDMTREGIVVTASLVCPEKLK